MKPVQEKWDIIKIDGYLVDIIHLINNYNLNYYPIL